MPWDRAEILSAAGFIQEVDKLNIYDKINHFERHISLNERTVTNTLHVSLSFDASERLSNEKMIKIGKRYMNKIGFRDQTFLVCRRHDAWHPHLYIFRTSP